jgi:hypothetical protein
MTQWGLDTLFNPAKRHMDEEKRRLQATRQQVGDTSGGKRIDLESGKVRIPKKSGEGEDDAVAEAAATEPEEKPARELTPAQQRAAERRRRKSH